jgi:hypothetical protein
MRTGNNYSGARRLHRKGRLLRPMAPGAGTGHGATILRRCEWSERVDGELISVAGAVIALEVGTRCAVRLVLDIAEVG